MKHLFITLDFAPALGGVSRIYQNVCASLHLAGETLTVVAPLTSHRDTTIPYPILRRNFSSRFFRPKWAILFVHLIKIFHSKKPDWVHVGHILPVGTVVWLLSYLFRFRYVVYVHAMDITVPARISRKRWLMKRILRRAYTIFSTNQYVIGQIRRLGINTPAGVYCPVPVHFKKPPSEEDILAFKRKQHLENAFVLLSVGRLVRRKGHADVLKALSQIKQKIPNLQYIIVGTGEEQQRLELLVTEYSLQSIVRFVGSPTDSELALWYCAADLFVMPSFALSNGDVEGFGIVFLEAAFFGLPAIGGKSGGMGEAIVDGKTGHLVDAHDHAQIAQWVTYYAQHPAECNAMGQVAQARVKSLQWEQEFQRIFHAVC